MPGDEQSILRFENVTVTLDETKVLDGITFEIAMIGKGDHKIEYHVHDRSVEADVPVEAAFEDILELSVPFDALGTEPKDKVDVWLSLKMKEMIIDRIPQRGYLAITAPSETFEAEMWYV